MRVIRFAAQLESRRSVAKRIASGVMIATDRKLPVFRSNPHESGIFDLVTFQPVTQGIAAYAEQFGSHDLVLGALLHSHMD